MYFLRRIYTLYTFIVFCLSFLFVFPILLISIWVPNCEKYGRKINYYWASIYFRIIFLNVEIKGKENIKKGQSYVFIANHFSYIDIPMMGFLSGDVVFVGKSSISRVPLFGYYFKKLHVMVNRSSLKSRGEALIRAKKAIDNGSSLIIFPEGGIITSNPPYMNAFKDGPFIIGIDKQIPIIPVTLSFNHLILPDDGKNILNFHKGKMVIHKAVATKGLTDKDTALIKEKCFEIIQQQLLVDNNIEILDQKYISR
jgi:1-acyl-sn-glycerol-3-phosphate acyltransferase